MIVRKWWTPVYRMASYEPYDGKKPNFDDSVIEHEEDISQYKNIFKPELDMEVYTYRQNGVIIEQIATYYPKGDRKSIVFREKINEKESSKVTPVP